MTYVFKRNDNTKLEFEIFNTDIKYENPKLIIESLKDEILSLF